VGSVGSGYLLCQEIENLVTIVRLPCRPDKKKCLNILHEEKNPAREAGMKQMMR